MALMRQVSTCYQHTQATPSATWVITHNLGMYPVVDIFVLFENEYHKIMPAGVTYDSGNQCTITFSTPRQGYATVT